jgi:hypothetical protein
VLSSAKETAHGRVVWLAGRRQLDAIRIARARIIFDALVRLKKPLQIGGFSQWLDKR